MYGEKKRNGWCFTNELNHKCCTYQSWECGIQEVFQSCGDLVRLQSKKIKFVLFIPVKYIVFIPVKYIGSIINTHIYSKFNVKNQKAVGQVERQEVPKRQDKKNCHVVS